MQLLSASLKSVADSVKNKKISATEVTNFFLSRAEKLNPQLNAFIAFNEKAIEDAKKN